MPVPDNSLDFIFGSHVFEHLANPIGHLKRWHAKLKPGVTLMHVIAMTRALGKLQTVKDVQPEVFRWTDGTDSHVTCTFVGGKLAHHELFRPGPALQASLG